MVMPEERQRLVEIAPVADIFACGLGEIQSLGGNCYRFVMFSRQMIGNDEAAVVVAKVVVPMEAVPPALLLAARTVGFSLATGRYFPKLALH